MLTKYIVTFDVQNGVPNDYNKIHESVKSTFTANSDGYIRIKSLSTVYLMKTKLGINDLRIFFSNSIKKTVYVIVITYDGKCSAYLKGSDIDFLNKEKY